ncbi:MAG: Methionine aminopeptidase [Candidatus Gottesmanbacteria bacterium GW2011_GWA1_34_13]|uniref:Methionine aminopeptidase n=1 Tax=Candidatus Gottesmanbacteria bacterium GW2011_GWA1_34_13 TaxID=1618434 RepID=A0A0G0D937_9BACT|nr:MAG: Methionine aminopeptidase [Candidatus Gottesmanbacteria bacterium GW2011_GWA1_34_13]
MSVLKNQADIDVLVKCGSYLHQIKTQLMQEIKIGKTPLYIDNLAKDLIFKVGGSPSFMTVKGYKWATCITVNDEVVHGVPDNDPFLEGDIVSLDIGLLCKGWHTDTSYTKYLKLETRNSKLENEVEKFLDIGKLALKKAIVQVKPGNRIGHISHAIQETVENAGYSVVKTLVGHGIGNNLHESPYIPGILTKSIAKTPEIKVGMALAIEVIYNMGKPQIVYKNDDNWTLATADGSLSGLFEETVLVTDKGSQVLT